MVDKGLMKHEGENGVENNIIKIKVFFFKFIRRRIQASNHYSTLIIYNGVRLKWMVLISQQFKVTLCHASATIFMFSEVFITTSS